MNAIGPIPIPKMTVYVLLHATGPFRLCKTEAESKRIVKLYFPEPLEVKKAGFWNDKGKHFIEFDGKTFEANAEGLIFREASLPA